MSEPHPDNLSGYDKAKVRFFTRRNLNTKIGAPSELVASVPKSTHYIEGWNAETDDAAIGSAHLLMGERNIEGAMDVLTGHTERKESADIARVCWEADRALQVIAGDLTPASEGWDNLEQPAREAIIAAVAQARDADLPANPSNHDRLLYAIVKALM